jgi:hypothetical protein
VSRRALGLIVAGLAAAVVLWLWPKGGPEDPEAQVRALIAGVVAGVEAKDLGPLSDAMADDFRGPQGASRQEVKQIVLGQVLRNRENVAVFNPSLDVTVKGPSEAEISGTFLFARTKAKSADELPADAVGSAYRIDATVQRRDGDWKFVSATYAPISWP